jgi:UDP-N-acetylmuramoylalanine--D-glutamate ligase
VTAALAEAVEGETVLLAPACASFDQFASFEARGEAFEALVRDATAGWGPIMVNWLTARRPRS